MQALPTIRGRTAPCRPIRSTAIPHPLLATLVACAVATLPGCGSADGDAVEQPAELAPYMTQAQHHSQKLGYSIRAKNQPLADFYLDELREVLEHAADEIPEHDGYPIAQLIGEIALPGLEPVESAVARGKWELAWIEYGTMIDTCNACHAATEHEFLVVLPAAGEPPFNQDFTPLD